MEKLAEVQFLENWLSEHSSTLVKSLLEKKINLRVDQKQTTLASLSYRINAPLYCPVVAASRGTVIDIETLKVVSYSFTRFFNVTQQTNNSNFDWTNYRVEEKLDGSLLTLYPYKGKWFAASFSVATASGPVNKKGKKTFAQFFTEVYEKERLPYPSKEFIYVFELCSLENKVLIDYYEPHLNLLTVRCSKSFKELPEWRERKEFSEFHKPKLYKIDTHEPGCIRKLLEGMNKGETLTEEGLILVDKDNNRLKAKNIKFLQTHNHLNNGLVNIYELYLSGDLDEFVSYVPSFKKEAEEFYKKLSECRSVVNEGLSYARTLDVSIHERFKLLERFGSLRFLILEILNNFDSASTFDDYIEQTTSYKLKRLLSTTQTPTNQRND
jgi:hypothetical protein